MLGDRDAWIGIEPTGTQYNFASAPTMGIGQPHSLQNVDFQPSPVLYTFTCSAPRTYESVFAEVISTAFELAPDTLRHL